MIIHDTMISWREGRSVVRHGGINETVLEAISLLAVPLKGHDAYNIPTTLPSPFISDLATPSHSSYGLVSVSLPFLLLPLNPVCSCVHVHTCPRVVARGQYRSAERNTDRHGEEVDDNE